MEKIDLLKEALSDWKEKKMSDHSFCVVVKEILEPSKVTNEDIEWIRTVLKI